MPSMLARAHLESENHKLNDVLAQPSAMVQCWPRRPEDNGV